jgi:hypothetical protein
MQMNMEFGGDAVTQVSPAPAHPAIGLAVRAVLHPLRHFAPLGLDEARLTARAGPVGEPRHPIPVGAMHKAARRLPVDATGRPRPTAAKARPAPWQSPEGAAPAWRPPRAPPPPVTAKHADLCGSSRWPACCPLRESTACCIESRLRRFGNPPRVRFSGGWYKPTVCDTLDLSAADITILTVDTRRLAASVGSALRAS